MGSQSVLKLQKIENCLSLLGVELRFLGNLARNIFTEQYRLQLKYLLPKKGYTKN